MPEIFGSYRPGLPLGSSSWQWNLLNVGYNHQSNGRSDVLTRSWDRVYAEFGVERTNLALLARVWYPFNDDDNPDIADYYGYGSLTAIYKLDGHSLSLMVRGNLSEGRGAGQLTWMSPKILGPLRAYVQAFTGYGETLLDYNWPQNTIGVGLALNDML
jgi:phospholipase A1